jgi:RimJ/RimL family protein N-acetyltransferase
MLTLETGRLLLRSVEAADMAAIHELHSLPETDEFNTLGIPGNIQVTQELVGDWLLKQRAQPCTAYVLAIVKQGSRQLIGLMGMNLGRPKSASAEVWYKLHKDHWGNGYATEALNRLFRYAFEDLALHRIEAGCATGNIASIKVLEKVGMQREGHCRKILPVRGQWLDNYLYAILEENFFSENK